MVNLNNGSIWEAVSGIVLDIPSSIGSQTGFEICDRARVYVQNWTKNTIGSTAIAEKYQGAIIHKAAAMLLDSMTLLGADVSKVSIGDFSLDKGKSSNTADARDHYNELAERELQMIGRGIDFNQVYG